MNSSQLHLHSLNRLKIETHLWYTILDTRITCELEETYLRYLDREEVEKYRRFAFPQLKQQYLTTRALLKSVLSCYSDIHPKEFNFSKNEWGRPEIKNQHRPPGLTFNISHTDGLVVCLIGLGREIGVDAEYVNRPVMVRELAKSSFSLAEQESLFRLPVEKQQQAFFEFWTLKEAYIKARGMGFSLALEQFSFTIHENGTIQVKFTEGSDNQDTWQFNLLNLTSNHQVAVAIRRQNEPDLSIVEIQTIPFQWDRGIKIQ